MGWGLTTRMTAEWISGRASRAGCGRGAPESSSCSLEMSEGEEIRGGIRGGLSLRQRVILAGLASVMIALSASAGGARSDELMSSFPDPDERPHASKGDPAEVQLFRVSPPPPHTHLPISATDARRHKTQAQENAFNSASHEAQEAPVLRTSFI